MDANIFTKYIFKRVLKLSNRYLFCRFKLIKKEFMNHILRLLLFLQVKFQQRNYICQLLWLNLLDLGINIWIARISLDVVFGALGKLWFLFTLNSFSIILLDFYTETSIFLHVILGEILESIFIVDRYGQIVILLLNLLLQLCDYVLIILILSLKLINLSSVATHVNRWSLGNVWIILLRLRILIWTYLTCIGGFLQFKVLN